MPVVTFAVRHGGSDARGQLPFTRALQVPYGLSIAFNFSSFHNISITSTAAAALIMIAVFQHFKSFGIACDSFFN
ncbi:hypothetical protein ACINLE_04335 [Bacillus sp. z60-18]|uniref:hypothetical protein n=1 Tax=unclassified Bacillus (in: firmicutes) TaxID=185979 RepID=UPI0024094092|nr:hypothetical protein [Bacillus sp. HSf4]WFA05120.1 hypothetical protein P3X63_21570 [Bacillus sp. HSf4]